MPRKSGPGKPAAVALLLDTLSFDTEIAGHNAQHLCCVGSVCYENEKDSALQVVYPEYWPTGRREAANHQIERAARIDLSAPEEGPRTITGISTAYGYGGKMVYAAAVTMTFPELQAVERSYAFCDVRFPYVPGLIFYREGEVMLRALAALEEQTDSLLVAGHGLAHPRRCGIACQIGLLTNCRAIGCARRMLAGEHHPVDITQGSCEPILLAGREVGVAYRSKDNVKPIFISPGYRCDTAYSLDIVKRCLRGYRLPEPLRVAHLLAGKHKRIMERNIVKAASATPTDNDGR